MRSLSGTSWRARPRCHRRRWLTYRGANAPLRDSAETGFVSLWFSAVSGRFAARLSSTQVHVDTGRTTRDRSLGCFFQYMCRKIGSFPDPTSQICVDTPLVDTPLGICTCFPRAGNRPPLFGISCDSASDAQSATPHRLCPGDGPQRPITPTKTLRGAT